MLRGFPKRLVVIAVLLFATTEATRSSSDSSVPSGSYYYSMKASSSASSTSSPSGARSLGTGSVVDCPHNDNESKVVGLVSHKLQQKQQQQQAAWKSRTDTSLTAASDESDVSSHSTSPRPRRNPLLGGEACLLDETAELQGVEEMLLMLTKEDRDAMPDIAMPIRHLRAEKGDVKKAVEKLRLALQWRKDFEVESLLACMSSDETNVDPDEQKRREQYKQLMMKEAEPGKIYIRSHDKDGRALVYMRPARENTNHEMGNMKHLVWNLEKAIACTKRQSLQKLKTAQNDNSSNGDGDGSSNNRIQEPKEKVVLIIDYTHFKLSNAPPLSTSRFTLDILQKHYPERMHKAYLLHTPFVFNAFWTVIKPFVDPVTKEKIVFCNNAKGLAKLHEQMGDGMTMLESVAGGKAETFSPESFDVENYLSKPFDETL